MTDNSSNSYTYYSFPPTPNRNSPRTNRSQSISSTVSATSQRALNPIIEPQESESNMPSPAAGKGETPRTPTKIGRKPQQSAPKLGKPAKSQTSEENPDLPSPQEKAEGTQKKVEDTNDQAQEGADDN